MAFGIMDLMGEFYSKYMMEQVVAQTQAQVGVP
jgi:hypothetical protein